MPIFYRKNHIRKQNQEVDKILKINCISSAVRSMIDSFYRTLLVEKATPIIYNSGGPLQFSMSHRVFYYYYILK